MHKLILGRFEMGFFFKFLLKWDRFQKNYKSGQVVPSWQDFIGRSRAKLT